MYIYSYPYTCIYFLHFPHALNSCLLSYLFIPTKFKYKMSLLFTVQTYLYFFSEYWLLFIAVVSIIWRMLSN